MPPLLTSQAVPEPPALQLDLPDPDRDDISTMEFLARLEQAWAVCDRFDLQTEIWRGRILSVIAKNVAGRAGELVSCSGCGSVRSAKPGPTD